MFSSRRLSLALLTFLALLAASCSSSDSSSVSVGDDTGTGTEASTTVADSGAADDGAGSDDEGAAAAPADEDATDAEAEEPAEAEPGQFITAPGSCLQTPIFLENLPPSNFFVMTEDQIFECLGIDAFQSEVTFDGELPSGPASVVVTSTQRLDADVLAAIGTISQDGAVTEQLVRIGEDAWEGDGAGNWSPVELGLGQLFNEQGEIRLSMTGALYLLSVFGSGAEEVGQEDLGGRTVTRWEADAAAIETFVNGLGLSPVPIGVDAGFVTLWTTDDGLIVKLDGEIRAADVTLSGIPVDQVDPVVLGLPADALDIVPDYAMTYELYDFDHDIAIEAPVAG